MIASLRTFSNDKLTFWRESASGINRVAYFLAKDVVDLFNVVLKPVIYLSMFYSFSNPRSTFTDNFTVTVVLVYCVTGIAYICAILLQPAPAQLVSPQQTHYNQNLQIGISNSRGNNVNVHFLEFLNAGSEELQTWLLLIRYWNILQQICVVLQWHVFNIFSAVVSIPSYSGYIDCSFQKDRDIACLYLYQLRSVGKWGLCGCQCSKVRPFST